MKVVRALVLTGYGLNCDYETGYALETAGAHSRRVHINELIKGDRIGSREVLEDYHILVFDGGFSWGDDHGAGVLLANRLRFTIGDQIERFIADGKLIIGICNGFQALVNLGLLPGFDGDYHSRKVALTGNDCGNFRDDWVHLQTAETRSFFATGIDRIELPIRHGEGKFFAEEGVLKRLFDEKLVVFQYADPDGAPAQGRFPLNPNGSLRDIAGICDPTGRILGMMPHPEAFNHITNHPDWTRKKEELKRRGSSLSEEGGGIKIFRNAVEYVTGMLL
ncbi:MAG: phosphoribosylformylglycinamidine synthase subunit PurQ [Deltaproteobacteria bacterium]|nr:phosphoribosylformylglycinamidine synthase subunit PurQ [Deltaproteobacteria bacterium]